MNEFKSWLVHNMPQLERTFVQLQAEGGGPPDFFEWVAVQHEFELIRATVQPC